MNYPKGNSLAREAVKPHSTNRVESFIEGSGILIKQTNYMFKWQEIYLKAIAEMSNEEVLDEYTELCCGDDYEGTYTFRGEWRYEKITEEFHKRLIACGFLLSEILF